MIEAGYCQCGCGEKTWIATINSGKRGWTKGYPVRFRKGHAVRDDRHYKWTGELATDISKRHRLRKHIPTLDGFLCETCGKPATDRHHKDGNPGNNTSSNIALLCRRCHMSADGRLAKFKDKQKELAIKQVKPPVPCIVCFQLRKPLRKGRCHACNEYFRRNGRERVKAA